MIDDSGKYWKGENFADLKEYMNLLYEQDTNSKIGKILQSKCSCENTYFILYFEQNESIAKRICPKCRKETFIGDSEEYWNDAIKDSKPKKLNCIGCKNDEHEIGIGFDYMEDGEISRIIIGTQCKTCGFLASPLDWKIDYSPTKHLEKKI